MEAAATAREAAAAFDAAQAELLVAESWQDKADQASSAAWQDARDALGWNPIKDGEELADAAREGLEAVADEVRAGLDFAKYGLLLAKALALQALADTERTAAAVTAQLAKGAAEAAQYADDVADADERNAEALGVIASQDKAAAAEDRSVAAGLAAAYASELARKAAQIAKAAAAKIAEAAQTVAKTVAKAAVVVANAAYKYSGAQSVVSCVTDPHLSSCIQAAVTIALVVGTGGTGEVADVAAEGAIDVAEDAGSAAAEDAGAAAEDGTPIYRGVAKGHNAFEDAQQGIASPGDVAGHADVYAHNVLDDTWTSRLTSWSTEKEVAEGFAGKNGVILQTTIEEMQARGVNILESPDYYDESEILLEGTIDGLKVTQP